MENSENQEYKDSQFWKHILFAEITFFTQLLDKLIKEEKLTREELIHLVKEIRNDDVYLSVFLNRLDSHK